MAGDTCPHMAQVLLFVPHALPRPCHLPPPSPLPLIKKWGLYPSLDTRQLLVIHKVRLSNMTSGYVTSLVRSYQREGFLLGTLLWTHPRKLNTVLWISKAPAWKSHIQATGLPKCPTNSQHQPPSMWMKDLQKISTPVFQLPCLMLSVNKTELFLLGPTYITESWEN